MQRLYAVCCGLDVHKKTVTACLLRWGAQGQALKEWRTFGTSTSQLLALADWLMRRACTHVAMESTGVYWKPVYNLLEGVCAVLVVNAQPIKNVPGRKTDVKDAEWIAELLAQGLLRGSFVPPPEIRARRDLTRYRKTLIRRRADECNRIQKLLETCNIKLASVATDVLGVSARQMLEALAAGESDTAKMAGWARGRLRAKVPQLTEALQGVVTDHHRWLLREQLEHIRQLDEAIARLDAKIEEHLRPFVDQIKKLCPIPGVSQRTAQVILAEIGSNMKQFPSADHLASWAGMCPGNHESAGNSKGGRTRRGSPWLKAALVEAGWAASHTRQTYLAAQYRSLVRRRGKQRACLAVGHSILRIAYVLVSHDDLEYQDLGPDYLDRVTKERLQRYLLRRLRSLGLQVTVENAA